MHKLPPLLLPFVGLLWFSPGPLLAHDFWSNGQRVDPATKFLCCGNSDHFELNEDQVTFVEKGFRIQGVFVTDEGAVRLDQTVPANRAQPSPDGKYHINLVDGRIRCFFAPFSY